MTFHKDDIKKHLISLVGVCFLAAVFYGYVSYMFKRELKLSWVRTFRDEDRVEMGPWYELNSVLMSNNQGQIRDFFVRYGYDYRPVLLPENVKIISAQTTLISIIPVKEIRMKKVTDWGGHSVHSIVWFDGKLMHENGRLEISWDQYRGCWSFSMMKSDVPFIEGNRFMDGLW